MKKERILPIGVVVALDLLLIGAILCAFCWNHHIKALWIGLDDDENLPQIHFTNSNPPLNDPIEDDPSITDDGYDYSGAFGPKFGQLFLKDGEEIISTANEYKSRDLWITMEEVNTQLVYQGKTDTVQYYIYDIYVRNIENLYTVSTSAREPIAANF